MRFYTLLILFSLISSSLLAQNITVTNHNNSGSGSLRNAISTATSGSTITFSSSLSGDSIVLSSGEIQISKNLTITGPGADKLRIVSNNTSRIFSIDSNISIKITGLSLMRAKSTTHGGAILNKGTLTLEHCYFAYNHAAYSGGAIFNKGEIDISYSTFAYNQADSNGGALANENALLSLFNSTVSSNKAKFRGGGIYNKSLDNTSVPRTWLKHVTLAFNRSGTEGGGIANTFNNYLDTAIYYLESSLIAENMAGTYAKDIFRDLSSRCIIFSYGSNLVGNSDSSGIQGTTGDILGNSTSPMEARLKPLAVYSGDMPVHRLDCGSPALDAGGFGSYPDDQEGNKRPFYGVNDIGAIEAQVDMYIPVVYLGSDIDTCVGTTINLDAFSSDSVNWYLNSNIAAADTPKFQFISSKYDSVIVEAISVAGCIGRDTMLVKLFDKKKPQIQNCPGKVTSYISIPGCLGTATWTPPTAIDDCGLDTIIGDFSPGDTFAIGQTDVVYRAYDLAGNYDSCIVRVIIKDSIKPVITCPGNMKQNIDSGACGAIVSYARPVANDNCSGTSIKLISGYDSAAFFPAGVTRVTWQATDNAGNIDSCSFTVTVVDTVFPKLICPADTEIVAESGKCGATITFSDPGFIENCTNYKLVQTDGLASGSFFPVGKHRIAYKISDVSNNTDTCEFFITIIDKEKPKIQCLADIETCDRTITYPDPDYSDNCSMSVLKRIKGLPSGSHFPVGTTTIVYVATDDAGNTDTCRFNIIVHPTPKVDLGPDKTVFYGDTFSFLPDVTYGYSYEWSPIDYLDNPNVKQPLAQPLDNISYALLVTSEFGCTASDTINVGVRYEFIIPSGFTPGDGNHLNDVWDIKGIIKYPDCEVSIYDRWGRQIFFSKGYTEKWDGTFEGNDLPMDTYYYIVNLNDGSEVRTGTVTLIR